jgi:hypothetical protein
MEDISAWVESALTFLAGVAVTVGVLRFVVMPRLRDAAELTTATWDDDVIEAVDTTLAVADKYVGAFLDATGRQKALESARREALTDLGYDVDDDGEPDA